MVLGIHVEAQDGVDAGLVAFALGLEPVQDICIQADGDGMLGRRNAQQGAVKEFIALFGQVGEIDLVILQGRQALPVSLRGWQSGPGQQFKTAP